MVVIGRTRESLSTPEPADPKTGTGQATPEPYASAQDRVAAYSDDAHGCDLPDTDDWRIW